MYKIGLHILFIFILISVIPCIFVSCAEDEIRYTDAIENRDSIPLLKSIGVSTLISDSGIVSYRLIAEEWFVYDKKEPAYWSFEKGLFMEKYDKSFKVEAYLHCDTAYYYYDSRIWELRGRVNVRNSRGETFKTSILYWDQHEKRIYSDQYMEIKGIDRELSGYDFYSNEMMTDYEIHSSRAKFPISEDRTEPHPDPVIMSEMRDTVSNDSNNINIQIDSLTNNNPNTSKTIKNVNQMKDSVK